MSGPQASVVIPAHNEEHSLPGNLKFLLKSASGGEFEVVVVANGCRDRTADAVREVSEHLRIPVLVTEMTESSKTAALNAGDLNATCFPRVYLDADVACSTATLRSLVTALQSADCELAVAARRLDLTRASWPARRYYEAWQSLPRVQAELSGRGAFAFSREGRERFGAFPDLIADDYWAVRQVPRHRAVIVPDEILIRPPMDLASLVRVRSRIYAANRATAIPADAAPPSADLAFLIRNPRRWLSGAVFLGANTFVKSVGVRRFRHGRDSARGIVAGTARGRVPGTDE